MKIDLFTIGKFTLHGYGAMIAIGFVIAMLVATYRAKRYKLNDSAVIDLSIIAIVCGFLGAKILFVLTEFKNFIDNPLSVMGSSGFVVYGGIIGGVICCLIYCKIKKLYFLDYFDLVMPEVAIAQAFGRIGCFLAGCCYGRETTSSLAVVFPHGCMAPAGIKLVPTQLYSAAGDMLIAIILIVIAHKLSYAAVISREESLSNAKHLLRGEIGCIYMMLYGVGRFIIEIFRNDNRGTVGSLSTSQFISIFIILFGIGLMIFNRIRDYKSSN